MLEPIIRNGTSSSFSFFQAGFLLLFFFFFRGMLREAIQDVGAAPEGEGGGNRDH